jgi:hypothetical protein
VNLKVEAATRKFKVYLKEEQIKQLDLKGLHDRRELSFAEYVELITQEASREYHLANAKKFQAKKQR